MFIFDKNRKLIGFILKVSWWCIRKHLIIGCTEITFSENKITKCCIFDGDCNIVGYNECWVFFVNHSAIYWCKYWVLENGWLVIIFIEKPVFYIWVVK